jgi:magnesium and cobalt exporter, CNNM family
MRVFYLTTKPLVDLFNGLGNLILRPFGIPPAREGRPWPDFVPLGVTVADAAREAVHCGHTRLLLVDRDRGLEAPVGLIHVHDLLAATLDDETMGLRPLLRPLARIPSKTLVTELLKRMLRERRHMVLAATRTDGRWGC